MGGIILPATRSIYLQRKERKALFSVSDQGSRSIQGLPPLTLGPRAWVKMAVQMALLSCIWCLDQHFLLHISTFLLKTILKHLKVKFCSRILKSLLTEILHQVLTLVIADRTVSVLVTPPCVLWEMQLSCPRCPACTSREESHGAHLAVGFEEEN